MPKSTLARYRSAWSGFWQLVKPWWHQLANSSSRSFQTSRRNQGWLKLQCGCSGWFTPPFLLCGSWAMLGDVLRYTTSMARQKPALGSHISWWRDTMLRSWELLCQLENHSPMWLSVFSSRTTRVTMVTSQRKAWHQPSPDQLVNSSLVEIVLPRAIWKILRRPTWHSSISPSCVPEQQMPLSLSIKQVSCGEASCWGNIEIWHDMTWYDWESNNGQIVLRCFKMFKDIYPSNLETSLQCPKHPKTIPMFAMSRRVPLRSPCPRWFVQSAKWHQWDLPLHGSQRFSGHMAKICQDAKDPWGRRCALFHEDFRSRFWVVCTHGRPIQTGTANFNRKFKTKVSRIQT